MGIIAVASPLYSNHVLPWLALYIGPDVLLPITSAFAAVVGVLLMFWHRVVGVARRLWTMMSRREG